jgi:hypothetical protein
MAGMYTVQQGDCLSSIAAAFKLASWKRIYDDPQNADFRTLRPDPNLIYPGDQVFVPDPEERIEPRPTEDRHKFVKKAVPTYVNLCVRNNAGHAIAGADYKLTFDTGPVVKDKTDTEGWIKQPIPPATKSGSLQVWPNPQDEHTVITWRLNLGCLDPIETVSGIKGRLNNLGYDVGRVDNQQDDAYFAAVRQFQQDNDLDVDGIVGPITRGKLTEEHKV